MDFLLQSQAEDLIYGSKGCWKFIDGKWVLNGRNALLLTPTPDIDTIVRTGTNERETGI